MRRGLTVPISLLMCALVACSGDTKDAAGKPTGSGDDAAPVTPSASPTSQPAIEPSTEPTQAPARLDPAELLVQRDEASGSWEPEDANAGSAKATNNRTCTELAEGQYSDAAGSDLAAIGWFNPKTINVLRSAQVVRVFPSVDEATAFVSNLRAQLGKCPAWKDGPAAPPGITSRISFFPLPGGYGEQTIGWRQQSAFSVGTPASIWHVTARYANVVSTVDSISLDDVQRLAIRDVRAYADQAGRLILDAQDQASQ